MLTPRNRVGGKTIPPPPNLRQGWEGVLSGVFRRLHPSLPRSRFCLLSQSSAPLCDETKTAARETSFIRLISGGCGVSFFTSFPSRS